MKKSALLWAALSPFLLGCAATRDLLSGEEEKQERAKIEYSASEQPRELDLPPDLINSFESEFDGPVNYSQYRLGDIDAGPRVAASPDDDADIRYLRAGGLRWLVVARPPEQVWPLARAFLLDFGFALEIDSAELGVLETDWLENRARARAGGFTGIIDKALDRFWDTGERDKFRLRIEPGERAQTTEVYLSHRGIASRFARRTDLFEGFERLPPNPQLEVEMLRRLMIRLSGQEPAQIDAIVSAGENAADPRPPDSSGGLLVTGDNARRRFLVALDRGGFTIEPQTDAPSAAADLVFIRYEGEAEAESESGNPFERIAALFSKEDKTPRRLRLRLSPTADALRVSVEDENGRALDDETARRILRIIADNLPYPSASSRG